LRSEIRSTSISCHKTDTYPIVFDNSSIKELCDCGFTGLKECVFVAPLMVRLYNAGSDTTYTLHAMFMIAMNGSESRDLGARDREVGTFTRTYTIHLRYMNVNVGKAPQRSVRFNAPKSPSENKRI
jgi:hypothetical protein